MRDLWNVEKSDQNFANQRCPSEIEKTERCCDRCFMHVERFNWYLIICSYQIYHVGVTNIEI